MHIMGLFKGKLNIGKLVGDVTSGIDKAILTSEEKLDFSVKLADSLADYVGSTISENSARSITRRYLAVIIISVYLLLLIGACVISLWNVDKAMFVFNVACKLNTLVLMVGAFFFGAYMVGNHLLDKKKKRDK